MKGGGSRAPSGHQVSGIILGTAAALWLAGAVVFGAWWMRKYVLEFNGCSDLKAGSPSVALVFALVAAVPGMVLFLSASANLGKPWRWSLSRLVSGTVIVSLLLWLGGALWPKPGVPCESGRLLRSVVEGLIPAQEDFKADSGRYASSLAELGFRDNPSLPTTIDWASASGWAAHTVFADRTRPWACGVIIGSEWRDSTELPATMQADEHACWDRRAPQRAKPRPL